MTTEVVSVPPDERVGNLYAMLRRLPMHHLLVMERGTLLGIISDRDILRNLSPFSNTEHANERDAFLSQRFARDIMSQQVVTVARNASIRDAGALMVEHAISLLPVLDEHKKVCGVLSWRDVLRYLCT